MKSPTETAGSRPPRPFLFAAEAWPVHRRRFGYRVEPPPTVYQQWRWSRMGDVLTAMLVGDPTDRASAAEAVSSICNTAMGELCQPAPGEPAQAVGPMAPRAAEGSVPVVTPNRAADPFPGEPVTEPLTRARAEDASPPPGDEEHWSPALRVSDWAAVFGKGSTSTRDQLKKRRGKGLARHIKAERRWQVRQGAISAKQWDHAATIADQQKADAGRREKQRMANAADKKRSRSKAAG